MPSSTTVATDPDRPVIVLFRHDLRLADNRALSQAAATGKPVLPAFILDETSGGSRAPGAARRWWLHHSLKSLAAGLERLGAPLVLRRGAMLPMVEALIARSGADMVMWNRRYDPPGARTDADMKTTLSAAGIATASFEGQLLHEPTRLLTSSGGHYKVYSPFWRALAAGPQPRDPIAAPKRLRGLEQPPASGDLDDWNLLPSRPDWAGGLRAEWSPGERGAHDRLDAFVEAHLDGYESGRDFPARPSTSMLSPHLAHGEITPFQLWHALDRTDRTGSEGDAQKFRKELAWREFCWHLLFHNPDLATHSYNGDFAGFAWSRSQNALEAWQQGRTGYPIVDAGMRQLWQTGWMHNRVRMVCASFLAKHLLIDWREGERWFWDTLVDADAANNPASWQWVAGSGADAAPYFRIFNPVLQGEKFDADGSYVRRFVPELAALPDRVLHKPWYDEPALAAAGVKLGEDYPVPVVEHGDARRRALQAYQSMKEDA